MDAGELRTLTELLDLGGFEVVAAESDRANKVRRLAVAPTGDVAGVCPGCGAASADRHACRDRDVADLPLGGWRTELTVRLWQFACPACGRYFTPPHAALADGAHATGRFLDRLGPERSRRGGRRTRTWRPRPGSWAWRRRRPSGGTTTTWNGCGPRPRRRTCGRSGRWGSTSCR